MLKKMVASLLTSVGILSLNANSALAERPVDFRYYKTLYPSSCNIAIAGERYRCDYTVVGAFNDASANIKLCSTRDCLILILTPTQLANVADGNYFYIRQMAWQTGNSITRQWNVSLTCSSSADSMGCIGEVENGSAIAIYVE
ncbi:hypothetical protein [Anabaena sp. CCY 9402-a]|uniref:hypothetical protein n=1 Tax=Anabaena sp. CCY 9402-a TaxID=3103867 RepID=UPI0039C64F8B